MAVTGPPEWRPSRTGPVLLGVVFGLQGVVQLTRPERDTFGLVLGVASLLVAGLGLVVGQSAVRVVADDDGLHVRDPWRRTTRVAWSEVEDIRPRRPGVVDPLVIVTGEGREIRTRLNPTDHRTLPRHWRSLTGRPEPT